MVSNIAFKIMNKVCTHTLRIGHSMHMFAICNMHLITASELTTTAAAQYNVSEWDKCRFRMMEPTPTTADCTVQYR